MSDQGKETSPASKSLARQLRYVLLIPLTLVVVGLCYLYGRFIEVNWIKTEYVHIPIRGLPQEFEGFKIVHLSDLHVVEMGKREKKLPAMVNSVSGSSSLATRPLPTCLNLTRILSPSTLIESYRGPL